MNRRKNWLIALFLLSANAFAWLSVAGRVELVEAVPILHPEIAEIRDHWRAGRRRGPELQRGCHRPNGHGDAGLVSSRRAPICLSAIRKSKSIQMG
ncbi:MAG: hypothetical protein M5U34_20430 [Chloroflexi bacterium]|nr:hypothetical protein [Chloroflexota bacterium]